MIYAFSKVKFLDSSLIHIVNDRAEVLNVVEVRHFQKGRDMVMGWKWPDEIEWVDDFWKYPCILTALKQGSCRD